MDENRLISLMENFTGQKFQWVKTNNPEQLGKVVKCRTIEPKGNRFLVLFDDGSSVDSTLLNTNLFMVHGDMEPLSRAEVEAINGPIRKAEPKTENPTPAPQPVTAVISPTSQPVVTQPSAPLTNMFDMFNAEESIVTMQVSVKLPDKKLLKMMYQNAENKDKFLDELSDYMQRMINKQVIKESIVNIVGAQKPTKKLIES